MVRENLGDKMKGPGEKIVQASDKRSSGLDEMAIKIIHQKKKRALEAHATHLDKTGISDTADKPLVAVWTQKWLGTPKMSCCSSFWGVRGGGKGRNAYL